VDIVGITTASGHIFTGSFFRASITSFRQRLIKAPGVMPPEARDGGLLCLQ